MAVRGSACFSDVAQWDAGGERGGDERVRNVCGPTRLVMAAWRATRRAIRPAA